MSKASEKEKPVLVSEKPMDYATMEAGPEMDALVAEKVMGLCTEHDLWPIHFPIQRINVHAIPQHWHCRKCGCVVTTPLAEPDLPLYSTDIAAAWQVVEKMVAKMSYEDPGFRWEGPLFKPEHNYLTAEGYPLGTTCWYVRLENEGERHWVCAESPALAICRAALMAVEKPEAEPCDSATAP